MIYGGEAIRNLFMRDIVPVNPNMDEKYGAEINIGFVHDEEGIHLGIHITDSEGLDVNSEASGESIEDVVVTAVAEIVDEIDNAVVEKEPEEDLDEIASIRMDLAALQARLDSYLNTH